MRDKYSDPAFTEDVRHLAFPLRRNSGPDSEFMKMLKKKSMKKSPDEETSIKQVDRNRKTNKSADFLCDHSSSSESLENIISSYKMRGKKGSSFDTGATFEEKPQMKPKRSSWFLRDRSHEKFFKRASLDFTIASSTSFDTKSRRNSKFQRQNATEYNTGDSSTTQNDEPSFEPKKSSSHSGLSKFQLGKRLLKGEIGIRSFNYYLLKEGLKKRGNSKNEVPKTPKSRSEENIYEEIYFRHDLPTPKPRAPPDLPPMNKTMSMTDSTKVADSNCANCEICLQEAAALDKNMTCDKCLDNGNIMISSDGYARVHRNNSSDNLIDYFNRQSNQQQPMLTFQSYNPNYPNIYKMETTPLVTPVEYGTIGGTDNLKNVYQSYKSMAAPMMSKRQNNEFYTRPNYLYPSSTASNIDKVKQERGEMFKTNSSNSIRSGGGAAAENETIYNGSQKSVQSNKSSGSNHDGHCLMSDSSLGDSLFSSDPKKRGFGSSESCAQRIESLEHEKCSFSDTTCNLRNCDCSSSYFSSDFDDNNIYNQTNLKPENYYEQQRANLCNEELSKRTKKNQNHYEVSKYQQRANDREKMSSNHLTTSSASAQQQKTSSSSTESSTRKKRITTRNVHEDITTATVQKDDDKIVRHQQSKDEKISSKEILSRKIKDNDVAKSAQNMTSRRSKLAENITGNDDNFADFSLCKTVKETEKIETKEETEILVS